MKKAKRGLEGFFTPKVYEVIEYRQEYTGKARTGKWVTIRTIQDVTGSFRIEVWEAGWPTVQKRLAVYPAFDAADAHRQVIWLWNNWEPPKATRKKRSTP